MPGVCLPFQERHFGTGKAWKHPGTMSIPLGERYLIHGDCKVQTNCCTQLDLREGLRLQCCLLSTADEVVEESAVGKADLPVVYTSQHVVLTTAALRICTNPHLVIK